MDWLKRARDGVVTQKWAAEKMGVSDRWVRKLLARMEEQGDRVVVHGLRGQPSNRRIAEQIQQRALQMLRQPDWHDFGPTFASGQSAKRYPDSGQQGNGTGLDDGGWVVEESVSLSPRRALLASAAKRVRGTGAMGRLGS